MSNSYQQAQYEQGKFAVEALSVGQFFAAALFPGLLLVGLYLIYILMRGLIRPQDMPPAALDEPRPSARQVLGTVIPPVLLIFAVLGAILGGVATPTEAASVGAIGAIMMAGARTGANPLIIVAGAAALIVLAVLSRLYPVRLQRSDLELAQYAAGCLYILLAIVSAAGIGFALRAIFRERTIHSAVDSTLTMTAMIFATILAAGMFSLVFIGLGGEERVAEILQAMPGGATGALLFCMVFVFILGFFLDFVEISVIVLPLVTPTLILMGHDPIWLGILLAINLQTSFLTPPFGFSLFYLRGAAPKEVTTGHIYSGVVPFIGLQVLGMLLVWLVPAVSTWLPAFLF